MSEIEAVVCCSRFDTCSLLYNYPGQEPALWHGSSDGSLEKLNHNYPVLEFGSKFLPVQVLLIRHK